MSNYILEMENISKTFPGVKALDNVQMKVKSGEVHSLVGENGAGKSTLIKILAGVYQPDPGAKFFFEGKEVEIKKPLDATKMGIAIIYQDLSLFPNLTVAENIYIGHDTDKKSWNNIDWKKIYNVAEKALNELEVDIDPKVEVRQLPIAKQQLVEIARALAFQSKLIVMDEPTSALSASEIEKLYEIIDDLKSRGISIIFIGHKLDELFRVADRFTVLRDGKYIGTYEKEEIDEQKLIRLMVGRDVTYEKLRSSEKTGETILEVRNLSKKGNFKDITFELRKGEVLGITGLVGSGRSELAQAIFGINPPDSGTIILNGQEIKIKSPFRAVQHGISYVPENRQLQGLVQQQTVQRNISLPSLKRMLNKFKLIDRKREIELAEKYIHELDVRPPLPKLPASNLSGGNQQKVVIGKWLATNPKLIIFDEPTNGIDIGAKSEIHKLIRNLADEGIGVIVISSELPEVLAISDRIIVMRHGRISGILNADEADQEIIMNYALKDRKSVTETQNVIGNSFEEVLK